MPGGEAKWSKEEVVACLDAKQGDNGFRKVETERRLEEKGVIVDGEKGWRMPRVRVLDVQNEIWKNDLLECVHRRNEISFDGMTMDKYKMSEKEVDESVRESAESTHDSSMEISSPEGDLMSEIIA
ncbi:unnamed protein product [Nezara viridula]|uniref:Uncharacterized protein n=1 Tax=Nezara viridula TaxID=85310 RepID=A0A9P0H1S4_NEZVI|nr:unnamed protein product [Nezara viridula]